MSAQEAAVSYHDFAHFSKMCKFRGCLHDSEPYCAIKAAVSEGQISRERYEHYLSFLKEIKNRKERY